MAVKLQAQPMPEKFPRKQEYEAAIMSRKKTGSGEVRQLSAEFPGRQ